jgi:hypothetical protein
MPDSSDIFTLIAYVLATICALLLIPIVLPVAVATNAKGSAEFLSGIPGISENGGFMSGFAVVILILAATVPVAVALNYAGFMPAVITTGNPTTGGPVDTPTTAPTHTSTVVPTTVSTPTATITSIATSSPTPTPMSTPTPTATPTPTPITTATPVPGDPYEEFYIELNGGLRANAETPIDVHGYSVVDNTLYFVLNGTAPSVDATKHLQEWQHIANAYASAVSGYKEENHSTELPSKMIVWDLNKTSYEKTPGTFTVQTEWANQVMNDEIEPEEYHSRWRDTIRPMTDEEINKSHILDRNTGNQTYHDTDD